MKKMLVISLVLAALSGSCGKGTGEGELTGVKGRPKYFEPDPFGMVFIPQGSFNNWVLVIRMCHGHKILHRRQFLLMLSGWMNLK